MIVVRVGPMIVWDHTWIRNAPAVSRQPSAVSRQPERLRFTIDDLRPTLLVVESFDVDPADVQLPLRDRMPDYLATFGIGLVVTFAIGILIWLISDIGLSSTIGYTTILYGVVFLLAGGATGGGYVNLGVGAVGSMFGGRRLDGSEPGLESQGQNRKKMDSSERLAKGLRPEANARAYWQVMGGLLYIAIGLAIVIIWP